MPIELVASAKILQGLNVSSDLNWNCLIDSIIKKAKERLYSFSQLKRSGIGTRDLVQIFCTCIHFITQYACPVFHDSLPAYLSNERKGVQIGLFALFSLSAWQRVFGWIKPNKTSRPPPGTCRQTIWGSCTDKENLNTSMSNLRNTRQFRPVFKTSRFRNSFITSNALKALYSFRSFDFFLSGRFLFFYFLFLNKSQFYMYCFYYYVYFCFAM